MIYRFAEFELLPAEGELRRGGIPVRLQPQPLRVLALLATRAGSTVPRREIFAAIWGETHVDYDRNLNYCIRRIREALGDDPAAPRFVRTVPRLGYRFVAPVERVGGPAARRARAGVAAAPAAARRAPRPGWRARAVWSAVAPAVVLAAVLAATIGPAPRMGPGTSIGIAAGASRGAEVDRGRDVRARGAWQRARYLAGRTDPRALERSIGFYEQALAIEPDWAEAWLGLAETWARLRADDDRNAARSRAAAERALVLDGGLAGAHAVLARLALYHDRDRDSAARAFARALALDPGSPELRQEHAAFLAAIGRLDEAIVEIEHAMRSDPVATSIKADGWWYYYAAGRRDDAEAVCRDILRVEPGHLDAYWCLFYTAWQGGQDEAAREAAGRIARLHGVDRPVNDLAAFWRWHVDNLNAEFPEHAPALALGIGYLALGRRGDALAVLERAAERRSACVLFAGAEPGLAPLRGDPRFEALLARIGLSG